MFLCLDICSTIVPRVSITQEYNTYCCQDFGNAGDWTGVANLRIFPLPVMFGHWNCQGSLTPAPVSLVYPHPYKDSLQSFLAEPNPTRFACKEQCEYLAEICTSICSVNKFVCCPFLLEISRQIIYLQIYIYCIHAGEGGRNH